MIVRLLVHVISAFFSNLLGHVFSYFHLLIDWKLDRGAGWDFCVIKKVVA